MVIVGGGIAGGALAAALASRGHAVVVLERQHEFRDRVRGENMQPWGVSRCTASAWSRCWSAPAVATASRPCCTTRSERPAEAEAAPLPLGMLLPDVAGTFSVGHPQACEALLRHAESCGARIVRGVGDVDVAPGAAPSVELRAATATCTRCAPGSWWLPTDGNRASAASSASSCTRWTRRRRWAGCCVRDEPWPENVEVLGTEGDVHFLVFPRPNGMVRLYLGRDAGADVGGPDRVERFLQSFRLDCCPARRRWPRPNPSGRAPPIPARIRGWIGRSPRASC